MPTSAVNTGAPATWPHSGADYGKTRHNRLPRSHELAITPTANSGNNRRGCRPDTADLQAGRQFKRFTQGPRISGARQRSGGPSSFTVCHLSLLLFVLLFDRGRLVGDMSSPQTSWSGRNLREGLR